MISFHKLIDVLQRLPTQSALPKFIHGETDPETAWVAWIEGDLELPQLDLDVPFAQGRPLHAMLTEPPPSATLTALVVNGNLTVAGAVSSMLEDYAEDAQGNIIPFPHLLVLGAMQAHDVVLAGQWLEVRGALHVAGLVWGEYGGLCVHQGLHAHAAVFTNRYTPDIQGGETIECLLDEVREQVPVNVLKHSAEALAFAFESAMLGGHNGIDDGRGSARCLFNRAALILALRDGQPVLKKDPHQHIAAMMPLPSDLLMDDAISVDNLRQVVNAARMLDFFRIDGAAPSCWWGDTELISGEPKPMAALAETAYSSASTKPGTSSLASKNPSHRLGSKKDSTACWARTNLLPPCWT